MASLEHVKQIFGRARSLAGIDRSRFVEGICGGRKELGREQEARPSQAAERLVRLYTLWDEFQPFTGKADKAAKWRQRHDSLIEPPEVAQPGPSPETNRHGRTAPVHGRKSPIEPRL